MKKFLLCGAVVFALSVFAAAGCFAQEDMSADKPDAAQTAFADALASASRQKTMTQFWNLVHPDSVACLSDEFKAVSELINFGDTIKTPIPADYKAMVGPIDPQEVTEFFTTIFGADVKIPVMPTHALALIYDENAGICKAATVNKMIYIAEKDGKWYEAMPCPATLPMTATDLKSKIDADEKAAAERFAALTPELKEELRKELTGDGGKIAAVKKAAAAQGLKFAEAKSVVEKLCREK